MQSSIFNKTGSFIVTANSNNNSKINLTGKFSIIEETVKHIEGETQALSRAAKVRFILFRSRRE